MESTQPHTIEPRNPKLLKIHLRYHPPGIILDYFDAYRVRKEKTIDLLDLNCGTNIPSLATELLNSDPLFYTHNHRMKCLDALERLKETQFHNFSKRYVQVQIIKPHSLPLTGAAFSKDGLRVATSCLANGSKVWNAQSGREIATLVGHEDAVTSINFNSLGDQILTSSSDGTLRHWRLDQDMLISCKNVLTTKTSISGDRKTTYTDDSGGRVLFCKYSPDNQMALSASDDKKACIHDLVQGVLRYKFCPELKSDQELNSVNMDKTGTLLLLSPHATCTAALFDLRTGEMTDTLEGHDMEVTKSIFDFGGQNIATSSWDCTVKLWDIRNLEEPVHTFCESDSEIMDIEFHPCGKSVVAGSAEGNIFVWDATKGKLLFEKEVQNSPLSKVVFSPNGAIVLGCNDFGTICMYHAELGSCLQTLPDHTREIVGTAFSYDSGHLMTASKDKSVRIYKHALIR